MAEFRINIRKLDSEPKPVSQTVRNEWLSEVFEGTDVRPAENAQDGEFEGFVQRSSGEILLQGRVRAAVAADCVRCLEEARVDVDTEVTTLFIERGSVPATQLDEEAAEGAPTRDFYDGDELVLDDLIREHILLEVPMKPLCSEDCKGIEIPAHIRPPEDFGREGDESVDPRLLPLKELRKRFMS